MSSITRVMLTWCYVRLALSAVDKWLLPKPDQVVGTLAPYNYSAERCSVNGGGLGAWWSMERLAWEQALSRCYEEL